MTVRTGEFIPYDAFLHPEPGYIVPLYFWSYMQRTIGMQAFERTVLTYDPKNPPTWQVERGNIGTDALRTLQQPQPAGPIEIPTAGARVTLPLHILAHVGQPGGQMIARLHWQDGTELMRIFPVLRGADGQGLVIGNLNWMHEGPPPQPSTQPATLEILSASGQLQARQTVTVLSAADPDTQLITLYWVLGEDVVPVQQRVPRTVRIGTAALNELLWGPGPLNLACFSTAIPKPGQVLSFPNHAPDWEARVTLRSLAIRDGVATPDFSRELKAYGGVSLRVMCIRQQIMQTLLQFPTVRTVRIAIKGQTEL